MPNFLGRKKGTEEIETEGWGNEEKEVKEGTGREREGEKGKGVKRGRRRKCIRGNKGAWLATRKENICLSPAKIYKLVSATVHALHTYIL